MPRVADVDHHRRVARDGFLNRGNPVVAGLQTVVGRARLQTRCGKGLRELMGHLDARASAAQEYLPEGQNTLCRHAGDCTSQMMKRFGISKRWQRPGSCCEIPIPPATKDRRGRKSKVSAGRPRGGDAMRLALRRQLTGPKMRAHFTICPKRPAASDHVERRPRNAKVKPGRPPGPRMKCGWGCGDQLTERKVRAHFTLCPKRPAAPGHVHRGRNPKAKRRRPTGRRMLCG
jgi:hypothetical protein